jgi:hypothetical protein
MADTKIGPADAQFLRSIDADNGRVKGPSVVDHAEAKAAIDGSARGEPDGVITKAETDVFVAANRALGVSDEQIKKVVNLAGHAKGATISVPPGDVTKVKRLPVDFDFSSVKVWGGLHDGSGRRVFLEDEKKNGIEIIIPPDGDELTLGTVEVRVRTPDQWSRPFEQLGQPDASRGGNEALPYSEVQLTKSLAKKLANAVQDGIHRGGWDKNEYPESVVADPVKPVKERVESFSHIINALRSLAA